MKKGLMYGIYIKNENRKHERKSYLNTFELEKFEAEKEVLNNINKIELMQCLGLKDKNGKLIYFGDILFDEANNTFLTPVIEIANAEHTLFFKPIHFLNSEIGMGCKSTYSETLMVIGNVYKNSELFVGIQERKKFVNFVISSTANENNNTTIMFKFKNQVFC